MSMLYEGLYNISGMTTFPSTGHVIPGHLHIFEPEAVYFHPDFDQDNFDYDAALVRVSCIASPNAIIIICCELTNHTRQQAKSKLDVLGYTRDSCDSTVCLC